MSNLGNKEVMASNIKYYMKMYNKTRNELCNALGIKYSTLSDWLNGNKYPRIDKIEMLANYFNIEKSDLVEDKSKAKPINELRFALQGKLDQLTDEELEEMNVLAEMALKRRNKQDK